MSYQSYRQKKKYKPKSSLTKIAFYLGITSAFVMFYLGARYVLSDVVADQTFGVITMLEGSFAIVGIYAIDLLNKRPISLKPKAFEKLHPQSFVRIPVILITLLAIQTIFQFVPLTVRDVEKAAAIIFAGPAEELFFRGVLITIFIRMGESMDKYAITKKKEISIVEIFGILLSATLFALLHVNYYGNTSVMMAVFVSGIALALFFWWWRDITSLILAHFLLNTITVVQVFYLINF